MSMIILMEKVVEKNCAVVVGIDPIIDRFPEYILNKFGSDYEKLVAFGKEVLDGVHNIVPAIKFQSAYFESYGIEGMRAFKDLIKYAKNKELYVIADIKRGDIGTTANAYARAYLEPGKDFEVDAITINPYLGDDSNNEFYKIAKKNNKGIFLLVKTSNRSSGQLQDIKIDAQKIYEKVAIDLKNNEYYDCDNNYSNLGAVIGATYPDEIKRARKLLPKSVFLVPGYGAQGGAAKNIAGAFDNGGLGAIVNSSRGIIYAYDRFGESVMKSSRKAAIEMRDDLNLWR